MVGSLRSAWVELAISVALLGLGVFVAAVAARMPATGGFSGVGPAAMPSIVATGLIIVGLWLTAERLTGGWRQAEGPPESRGEHAFHAPGFVWISAGLFGQMALIHTAGFVIAAIVLFTCVARGFGSAKPLRDAAIGTVLSLAIFLFFVKFLNVNLPAGWLKPVLGAAGI
jgi:putative tricarboxylic transport membrane protein